jgi:acetoacetyl-CoA synthetase
VARALRDAGVTAGDRVAGFMPNMPESIIAMLAATSLGATWSSCSPDFGIKGVLDRFGQIKPKVLFTARRLFFQGKAHRLPGAHRRYHGQIPSIERWWWSPTPKTRISVPSPTPC